MIEKSEKVNESQIDFLKPCPFCNGVVVPYTFSPTKTYHFKYIQCSKCKMLFTKKKWHKMDAKEVIKDWGVKE